MLGVLQQPERVRDVQRCSHWLGTLISTDIPQWVFRLVPRVHYDRSRNKVWDRTSLLREAVFAGTSRVNEMKWPQTSYEQLGAVMVSFTFAFEEALLLEAFRKEICVTYPGSVLRTAIMLGLQLPLVADGVMSCTRKDLLTYSEIQEMLYIAERVKTCPILKNL